MLFPYFGIEKNELVAGGMGGEGGGETDNLSNGSQRCVVLHRGKKKRTRSIMTRWTDNEDR